MINSFRRSQSIVEYLLVFAGLVLVALLGARMIAERGEDNAETGRTILSNANAELRENFGP